MYKTTIGNQSFDAKVENHEHVKYIEITNAVDGHDNILRMEELNKKGSVPAVGEIIIEGTKASGKQKMTFKHIAVSHCEQKNLYKKLIKRIIEKNEKINYPDKTILLVAFDDNLSFKTREDINELELFLKGHFDLTTSKFIGISLIGNSGKVFINTNS